MKRLLFAMLLVSLQLTFSAEAIKLLRGPWLTLPGTDTMTVNFVIANTDTRTFQVEYRAFGTEDPWSALSTNANSVAADKTLYYATLANLPEGRPVEYRVKASDGAATEQKVFRTFNRKKESHRIFVNSDIHNRSSMLSEMMNIGMKKNCDCYVLIGDQISNRMEGESFPIIFGGFLSDASRSSKGEYPLVVTRGNHECRGPNFKDWYKFFPAPENRTWHSFRIGPVWYMVLDSADADTDTIRKQIFPAQRKWMEEQFASEDCKTATFRVVLVHYSTNSMNEYILNLTPRPLIGNLLNSTDPEKRIHLVVSGHRHRYTRADAGYPKFKVNSCGFADAATGPSGKDYPYTQVVLDGRENGGVDYNCLIIEGTADKLEVESYNGQNKKLIDHFSIAPDGKVTDLMEVPEFDN